MKELNESSGLHRSVRRQLTMMMYQLFTTNRIKRVTVEHVEKTMVMPTHSNDTVKSAHYYWDGLVSFHAVFLYIIIAVDILLH